MATKVTKSRSVPLVNPRSHCITWVPPGFLLVICFRETGEWVLTSFVHMQNHADIALLDAQNITKPYKNMVFDGRFGYKLGKICRSESYFFQTCSNNPSNSPSNQWCFLMFFGFLELNCAVPAGECC